jgi:short-subunit dehydrogenase
MKTVLITGASSGIGRETALVFAEKGYHLVLTARRTELLATLKSEIEAKFQVSVYLISLDLAQNDSAEKLYEQVKAQALHIDVLINNAGFGLYGAHLENDPHKTEQMMVLNMISLTKLCHLFGNEMVKKGSGNIVNIASTAAFQPIPNMAVYAATKAYVMNFSDALAYELKDKHVVVTCINPGATKSEFAQVAEFKSDAIFKGNIPSSKDLAIFIYHSMQKGKTNVIHGLKNALMAFSIRFSPRKAATHIAAKMME